MLLGITCPSFFSISTWKVSDQKYPKDNLCQKHVLAFILKGNKTYVLGGYLKMWISSPNTREWNAKAFKSEAQMTQEETKNLQKTALTSKVMNPITRALAPPFIGRRRDFYISKVPSNLRNIPNVNSYMNVFCISYIYKPATISHVEPWLLRQCLWLGFLLIRKSLIHRNPHTPKPPNIIFSRFPNFTDSRFQNFVDSWFQIFLG
jgi:hypothetical protein